jgi:hypothetical protein
MEQSLDENFLQRVYRTTLGLAILIEVLLLLTWRVDWILSFAVGVGIGVGVLRALEWSIPRLTGAHGTRAGVLAAGVLLGKYIPIGLVIYLLLRWHLLAPAVLVGGLMLPYMVIVLKVAALVWLENRQEGTGTPPKS